MSGENSTKKQRGFTMVEMIITIFIFTMLAVGVISLVSNLFTTSNKQSALLGDTDQARKIANNFTSQLRTASTGADGSFSLNSAGDQQIIFFSTGGGAVVNRYRYFISGTNLKAGIIVPVNNAYNANSETVTTVQADLANGANPLFFYYDGTFNGTGGSLAQPINVTAVRFVKINLVVTNKAGLTGASTFTVSAGATIRNLKDNLGN